MSNSLAVTHRASFVDMMHELLPSAKTTISNYSSISKPIAYAISHMHYGVCRSFLQRAVNASTLSSILTRLGLPLAHQLPLNLTLIRERATFRYGFSPIELSDLHLLTPEIRQLLVENGICYDNQPRAPITVIPVTLADYPRPIVLADPLECDYLELQCLLNGIEYTRDDGMSIMFDRAVSIVVHLYQYLSYNDKASLCNLVSTVTPRFSRHKQLQYYVTQIEQSSSLTTDELPSELMFIVEAKNLYRRAPSLQSVALFLSHFTNVLDTIDFARVELLTQLINTHQYDQPFSKAVASVNIQNALTHRSVRNSHCLISQTLQLSELDVTASRVKTLSLF